MKDIIIAIDGFSGTGKSSTAKDVAKHLKYKYLDSGAMYRSVTWVSLKKKADVNNREEIVKIAEEVSIYFDEQGRVLVNKEDVTDKIRSMEVNENVSMVSSYKGVRDAMVAQQRKLGQSKRIVMDGRDIGTVVFPKAELKVFMTANSDIRAKRRQEELKKKGISEELSEIKANLIARDKMDSSREESPLVKSEEAIEIDTSDLTFENQVKRVVELAEKIIYES